MPPCGFFRVFCNRLSGEVGSSNSICTSPQWKNAVRTFCEGLLAMLTFEAERFFVEWNAFVQRTNSDAEMVDMFDHGIYGFLGVKKFEKT